jgi:hypothetical protein
MSDIPSVSDIYEGVSALMELPFSVRNAYKAYAANPLNDRDIVHESSKAKVALKVNLRKQQSMQDKINNLNKLTKAMNNYNNIPKKVANKTTSSIASPSSSAPAIASRLTNSSAPKIVSRSSKGIRVIHREFVSNIVGSSAFTVNVTLPINPGMNTFAPWLSSQAFAWEYYQFRRLRVCYYSRCGTNTPGSFMICPDYDAADAPPATEQIATTYNQCVEQAPWSEMFCVDLNPKSMHPGGVPKCIRSGGLAPNLDIKTYDAGNIHLITLDGSAVVWGKVWIEYDVELTVPQIPSSGFTLANSAHWTFSGSAPNNAPFQTSTPFTGNSSSIQISASNGLNIFTPGIFMIYFRITATTVDFNTHNISGGNLVQTFFSPNGFATVGGGTNTMAYFGVFQVTGPALSVSFNMTGSGSSTGTLAVAQMNSLQT